MNNFFKQLSFWIVILIIAISVYSLYTQKNVRPEEITLQEFQEGVLAGEIDKKNGVIKGLDTEGFRVEGRYVEGVKDGGPFFLETLDKDRLLDFVNVNGVNYKEKPPAENLAFHFLLNVVPIIILFGLIWFFMYRQVQGGNKALSFGKSRARLHSATQTPVTFQDVGGVDEAVDELQEIVEFLKDPKKFTKLGGKIPKGVLLMGPPGSGKTLLARAVAGEAKVPFFSISGSEFVEMFVGVGASRVRDLFAQAKKHAPCIIFIDEIDAVGRQRFAGMGGGHDEREQTLNQLLVEMDGFDPNEGVILMAATNRPDVLDQALLRPGRFDRRVMVDNPDIHGREKILKIHCKEMPLESDVDFKVLSRGTPGFSGADLANMVNEAALLAARLEREKVTMPHFEDAKDKVMMGPERRSLFISEEEKKLTAFHEAGHALVAKLIPGSDPVHKVTIIPRGRALGVTHSLPKEDRHNYSRTYLMNSIAGLMGGRAAEELIFQEMTTGAGNDIKRATEIVRRMVCEWGMSERLGPISFGGNDEVFLGRDFLKERNFSEHVAAEIDIEVRRFIDEAHEKAKNLLESNKELLIKVSEALTEREVLDSLDLDKIISTYRVQPSEVHAAN